MDVDQVDFGGFQLCLSGAEHPYPTGCDRSDLSGDGDVDEQDFTLFSNCLSGPGISASPGCAGN